MPFLACPSCGSENFVGRRDIECKNCGTTYGLDPSKIVTYQHKAKIPPNSDAKVVNVTIDEWVIIRKDLPVALYTSGLQGCVGLAMLNSTSCLLAHVSSQCTFATIGKYKPRLTMMRNNFSLSGGKPNGIVLFYASDSSKDTLKTLKSWLKTECEQKASTGCGIIQIDGAHEVCTREYFDGLEIFKSKRIDAKKSSFAFDNRWGIGGGSLCAKDWPIRDFADTGKYDEGQVSDQKYAGAYQTQGFNDRFMKETEVRIKKGIDNNNNKQMDE